VQVIVGCSLLNSVCGGKHEHWLGFRCRSLSWCQQLWGVRCCIWCVEVSISIGEVFDVAVSIGASDCGCSLLYLVCGGKHKRWRSVRCCSVDWCKQMWHVRCCIRYVVVSISIGEVFDVAVSIGVSKYGVFVVVFGMWW